MKTEREGTLGRHYNLVRPLVWKFLTQLKAELPQDPAPPLLSTHLNYVSLLAGCDLKGRLPPPPLTIVLFPVVKTTNQPICSSADERAANTHAHNEAVFAHQVHRHCVIAGDVAEPESII